MEQPLKPLAGVAARPPLSVRGVIDRTFRHRSGRVISLGRLALATTLFIAILLDSSQPRRYPVEGYAILFAYILFAASYLAATWSRWWLEFRAAGTARAIDIAFFGVMVFLTEGYTSPFFTFSVFLLLCATIKGGREATVRTAIVVVILYFAAGAAANAYSDDFDASRYLIRGTYLSVVSILLIWFAMNELGRVAGAATESALARPSGPEPPIRAALEHAARETGSERLIFAWRDQEEPWTHVATLESGRFAEERHAPGTFGDLAAPALGKAPFLFDTARGLALASGPSRPQLTALAAPIDPDFASSHAVGSGIAIPVEAERHSGLILALDVPGLCSDDLTTAARIAGTVSAALGRAAMIQLTQEAAETRTRLSLARDLHDNVAQLLAGTALRLEGIRASAERGGGVAGEIEALQAQLAGEQRDLRGFIHRLRGGSGGDPACPDLQPGIATLADRLAEQWAVRIAFAPGAVPIGGPPELAHEIHQLIREAVANAVRHGRARVVRITLEPAGGAVRLAVADDGCGFASHGVGEQAGAASRPWSLEERVAALGGRLHLASSAEGTSIRIDLPVGACS
jgi:signal transduction histidine kinase